MVYREYMEDRLDETNESDLPTICIPSYRRAEFELSKRILPSFSKKALDKVFIFVRQKQLDRYYKTNPKFQYVAIPPGAVSDLGSTRRFILDWAVANRLPIIMDMDDDIKYLQFLYNTWNARDVSCSAHTGIKDWHHDPKIPQKVLQLAGKISREVFRDHPDVMLGNIRKQRFSNHPEYAHTKYQISRGPTPRQTKILNVRGIHKAKLVIPPKAFDLHGEDMGCVAEILQKGYKCFNIPCLCYDYVDAATNSVVRDWKHPDSPETRALHQLEYDALQKMEVRHYLRETFKFDDGQYMFGDIDWLKYWKYRKTGPIVEYWQGDT